MFRRICFSHCPLDLEVIGAVSSCSYHRPCVRNHCDAMLSAAADSEVNDVAVLITLTIQRHKVAITFTCIAAKMSTVCSFLT